MLALASRWFYDTQQDPMRGTTDSHAFLGATNVRGHIELSKSTHNATTAWLILDRAQFVCAYEGCNVSVKFDDGPVEKMWFLRPSDGDTRTIGLADGRSFIARLRRSKHLFVEAELFQAGDVQMEFLTHGLVWKD